MIINLKKQKPIIKNINYKLISKQWHTDELLRNTTAYALEGGNVSIDY